MDSTAIEALDAFIVFAAHKRLHRMCMTLLKKTMEGVFRQTGRGFLLTRNSSLSRHVLVFKGTLLRHSVAWC